MTEDVMKLEGPPTNYIFVLITLLPSASALHHKQSCSVSFTLPLNPHSLSLAVSPRLLIQPPVFLPAHFIMPQLNILQPIAP